LAKSIPRQLSRLTKEKSVGATLAVARTAMDTNRSREEEKTTERLTASKILFENRGDAGRKLAAELASYAQQKVVVLAIPNGGVPLAVEVATALGAELDVLICRKFALPMNPEGGLGAVADDGTVIINEDVIKKDGISREQLEYEANEVKANIKQRSLKYKGERVPVRLTGKTVIIVDDGLASGITMAVAVEAVKHRRPKDLIVAIPVASAAGFDRVSHVTGKIVTMAVAAMSQYYLADFFRNWRDVSDEEVVMMLDKWRRNHSF
jgi:putative phosphoribosyl transferase